MGSQDISDRSDPADFSPALYILRGFSWMVLAHQINNIRWHRAEGRQMPHAWNILAQGLLWHSWCNADLLKKVFTCPFPRQIKDKACAISSIQIISGSGCNGSICLPVYVVIQLLFMIFHLVLLCNRNSCNSKVDGLVRPCRKTLLCYRCYKNIAENFL